MELGVYQGAIVSVIDDRGDYVNVEGEGTHAEGEDDEDYVATY